MIRLFTLEDVALRMETIHLESQVAGYSAEDGHIESDDLLFRALEILATLHPEHEDVITRLLESNVGIKPMWYA